MNERGVVDQRHTVTGKEGPILKQKPVQKKEKEEVISNQESTAILPKPEASQEDVKENSSPNAVIHNNGVDYQFQMNSNNSDECICSGFLLVNRTGKMHLEQKYPTYTVVYQNQQYQMQINDNLKNRKLQKHLSAVYICTLFNCRTLLPLEFLFHPNRLL